MSTSLSSLPNSLSDSSHNIKCKDCNSCFDYIDFCDNKLIYRCLECKTNYNKDFNSKLIDKFFKHIWFLW